MDSIQLWQNTTLHKHTDGSFTYCDTYGETHTFDGPGDIWAHLTEDGEVWPEEVETFIFD